jgi:hypothetical protein
MHRSVKGRTGRSSPRMPASKPAEGCQPAERRVANDLSQAGVGLEVHVHPTRREIVHDIFEVELVCQARGESDDCKKRKQPEHAPAIELENALPTQASTSRE